MSTPDPGPALAQRYGVPAPWRRRALLAACAVLVVAFGGWLAWVVLFHARPPVASELLGFEVSADDAVRAIVQVRLDEGVEASCRLVVRAEDHTTVGELSFTPTSGRNEVDVRTERRATSVELVGCTSPGQPRPR